MKKKFRIEQIDKTDKKMQILNLWKDLSAADKADLMKRFGYEKIEEQKEEGRGNVYAQILYESIAKEILIRTKVRVPSFYLVTARNDPRLAMLTTAITFLDSFLKEALGVKIVRRTEMLACIRWYAQLMSEYFVSRDYPLTVRQMLTSYEIFPSLLEKGFPGYIAAGLGHIIFGPLNVDLNKETLPVPRDSTTEEDEP